MNGGSDAKKKTFLDMLFGSVCTIFQLFTVFRFDRGRAQRNEKITFRYIIRVNIRIPTGCVPHGKLKSFLDILTGKLCVSTKFKFCIVFCLERRGAQTNPHKYKQTKDLLRLTRVTWN